MLSTMKETQDSMTTKNRHSSPFQRIFSLMRQHKLNIVQLPSYTVIISKRRSSWYYADIPWKIYSGNLGKPSERSISKTKPEG